MGLQKFGDSTAGRQLQQDLRQGTPAHAYLLAGSLCRDKEEIVSLFVQALLCREPADGNPCALCPSCQAWERGGHPDYHSLQPDGSSIKIDQLRLWQPFFRYSPDLGRKQVFLLQQPELLTAPAANSLLKVLEEPLPGTIFLLVTEDQRSLLPTIVSRCRVVFFRGSAKSQETVALGEEDSQETWEKLVRIITGGTAAELLREVRLLGTDRSAAHDLLEDILAYFEQVYQGQSSSQWLKAAACLELLLKGLRQLEVNASVSLVLSM
jgi:DNA polymerase-3 subunit delta'